VVDDAELAAIIARKIFEAGALYSAVPAERIQFMIGKNPERPGAGFGEKPLADFIEGVLREHRSY
jgi:hypothetical protein